MQLENFLLMRHELLLLLLALLVLVFEIFTDDGKIHKIIPWITGLFVLVTFAGFLPQTEGVLFGGMFRITGMQIMMKNILNVGVAIILLQSAVWLKKPENSGKISEYYILLLSTLIGMNFMISSGDFLMFYLGLELATIPMAVLAAFDRYRNNSAEAGIKLILSSALSSGILLFGLSMLYGMTGSIYFDAINANINQSPLMALSLIFFFAGMGFKISLVPFHLWTADVYEGAPVSVTSYLSVVSKGAAVFIFSIILFTVFDKLSGYWINMVYALAILTMTVGNLFAIRQKNMKRFLAFSSIAQAGFILLGILNASEFGMTTIMYFVLVYIFSNLGAFGVVSAISYFTGKENMDDYDSLYKNNPKLSLLLTISLFSLAGIPPFAGFFGKFFLFMSAASQGYYWLVFIAVLNATISLYYYLLPVKAMFINKSETPLPVIKSDVYTRIALILCAVGIFGVGFYSPVYEWIYQLVLQFGI
ncbi:MAG: NADH-quinone oxidoreductase subunit N [Bacteroidales bacterium]|nr:NADH-quinone oxidoreductase subunit N [Bacteroidales bacterium]